MLGLGDAYGVFMNEMKLIESGGVVVRTKKRFDDLAAEVRLDRSELRWAAEAYASALRYHAENVLAFAKGTK